MLTIKTRPEEQDTSLIHKFLKSSYWAKDITLEQVQTCINRSENFGLFNAENQIGYARVLTDFVRFAYLLDVFILEEERGKGYSKLILNYIFEQPQYAKIWKWKLGTLDAHFLYEKYGFHSLNQPEKMMEREP